MKGSLHKFQISCRYAFFSASTYVAKDEERSSCNWISSLVFSLFRFNQLKKNEWSKVSMEHTKSILRWLHGKKKEWYWIYINNANTAVPARHAGTAAEMRWNWIWRLGKMSWKWSKDDDRDSETQRENERNWKNNEFYFSDFKTSNFPAIQSHRYHG